MVYYLIVCRSLTYAQRTAGVLERVGISAYIYRLSAPLAGEGCGYCVKISQRNLSDALVVLNRAGLPPRRVYLLSSDGSYKEVRLL